MTEAEAFSRLEETCSMGHGPTVRKRRDCMTCQVLLLVEASEACTDRHVSDLDAIAKLLLDAGHAHEDGLVAAVKDLIANAVYLDGEVEKAQRERDGGAGGTGQRRW